MRASCLQSRLMQAVEDSSISEPYFGTYLKGVDPMKVASEMRRAIHETIVPRLAMADHPDDFGEMEVDDDFSIDLNHYEEWPNPTPDRFHELPVSIVMKNFGHEHEVFLDWQPGILAFGTSGFARRPQVVVFDQPDAVGTLLHWLTWSVADVFGREDD